MIRVFYISTWIAGLLRMWLSSQPSSCSVACDRCGLSIDAQRADGMSSSVYEIDWSPPKRSPSKFFVALTVDGKLSISCACDHSATSARTGAPDGISCSEKN